MRQVSQYEREQVSFTLFLGSAVSKQEVKISFTSTYRLACLFSKLSLPNKEIDHESMCVGDSKSSNLRAII